MIIADTHAWIWWVSNPGRLSKTARRALDGATAVGVSAISVWEVAMLVFRKKLRFDRDVATWIDDALAVEGIVPIPVSPSIALMAATIGSALHYDPADRLIVATTLESRTSLVTKDERIAESGVVTCVW